jgi:hypothetical protein
MNSINFTYESDDKTIYLEIDGKEAGSLELTTYYNDLYQIELIEIEEEFRGKGFYKMFLIAALNMVPNITGLFSNNRNQYSNKVYEKWTGKELDSKQEIVIYLENDNLNFTI